MVISPKSFGVPQGSAQLLSEKGACVTYFPSCLPPSSGVGQPTIGRPFYGQAKVQLRLTWRPSAGSPQSEGSRYKTIVNQLSLNTNRQEGAASSNSPLPVRFARHLPLGQGEARGALRDLLLCHRCCMTRSQSPFHRERGPIDEGSQVYYNVPKVPPSFTIYNLPFIIYHFLSPTRGRRFL